MCIRDSINSAQSTYTALDGGTYGTVAAPCSLYVDNTNGLHVINTSGPTNAIVANRIALYKGTVVLDNAADLMIGNGGLANIYFGNVNY